MIKLNYPTPKRPSRIVVVGSSGFVGSHLIKLLRRQALDFLALSSKDINLLQDESDRQLTQVLKKDDAVVFLSALTPDKGKDLKTLLQNLKMEENFVRGIKNANISHCIHFSSDAVYDEDLSFINETSPTSPGSLYGAMHLTRELTIRQAAKEQNISLAVLRPCAIYGAGDTHNSYGPNRFLSMAKRDNKIILFGKGAEKRDHIYIEDVVKLVELCLLHRLEGILNLASGVASSFQEVAVLVQSLFSNTKVNIENSPQVNPVTHKHFDTTRLVKVFPSFQMTPISVGLQQIFCSK